MSIAAAKLVEEFIQLEPAEQQVVWRALQECIKASTAPAGDDPIRSARGMLAGAGLNQALLTERAKERARG